MGCAIDRGMTRQCETVPQWAGWVDNRLGLVGMNGIGGIFIDAAWTVDHGNGGNPTATAGRRLDFHTTGFRCVTYVTG